MSSKKIIYIIRGLPGSGKTTLAHNLVSRHCCVAADDFMVDENGDYAFDASKLGECHRRCTEAVESMM